MGTTKLYTRYHQPLPILPLEFSLTMQSLHYMEKWEKQSTNEDHFDNLRLVGFSPCGTLIAFGGESGLLLVTACDGVLKAVVRHASSSLVALEWCSPGLETVIGAFENGTIMSISLSEVRLSKDCCHDHL